MADRRRPLTLTRENFAREILQSGKPALVDFWADWCGPCHRIAPLLEELVVDLDGKATIGKVNVDEQRALAEDHQIRAIPSLLFFRDGNVVERVTGVVPKRELASRLESLLQAA